MLVSINSGVKHFPAAEVFSDLNFQANPKEKIAIIGRNGSGKSTLLKIINQELSLDSGTLHLNSKIKIGYLKQTITYQEGEIVLDYLMSVFSELLNLEKTLASYQNKSFLNETEAFKYSELLSRYERLGGYQYQIQIKTIFTKFGFEESDLKKPLQEFSGGEQTKIGFVRLLLEEPELLLLDEPTNHLDLKTIVWLEGYLKNYRHALVIVSHDRKFINEIAEIIYEVEHGILTKYYGNYESYKNQKLVNAESLKRKYNAEVKRIAEIEEFIERNRYQKSKASLVQSKIKQLEKLDRIKLMPAAEKIIKFDFTPQYKGGKQVLEIKDLVFGFDQPLGKLDLKILKGMRIGIIGANGIGKSCLIITLALKLKPLSGELLYGHQIEASYLSQEIQSLKLEVSVIDYLWDLFPDLTLNQIRSALGSYSFSEDEVYKNLKSLSGGELMRLSLLKLSLEKANLLFLDEPTNHLDLASKESFETALTNYLGTVIFVSHDRYFLEKIATSLIIFENKQLFYFPHNYQSYLNQDNQVSKVVTTTKKSTIKKQPQLSLNKVEKEITRLEKQLESLNQKAFLPEYYLDYQKTHKLNQLIAEIELELAELLEIWENHHSNLD